MAVGCQEAHCVTSGSGPNMRWSPRIQHLLWTLSHTINMSLSHLPILSSQRVGGSGSFTLWGKLEILTTFIFLNLYSSVTFCFNKFKFTPHPPKFLQWIRMLYYESIFVMQVLTYSQYTHFYNICDKFYFTHQECTYVSPFCKTGSFCCKKKKKWPVRYCIKL